MKKAATSVDSVNMKPPEAPDDPASGGPDPAGRGPSFGSTIEGELTRERLVLAAVALAEGDGPNAVGLREVARRAGVTHTAPYRHFADREQLLVAVAERGFQELMRHCLELQRVCGDDPLDRFWALGFGYFTFAVERPGLFRAMFSPEAARAEDLRPAEAAVFSLCVSAIVAAQREGLVVEDDPQLLALVAWSSMHGAAMLYLDGLVSWVGIGGNASEIAGRLARQVFNGFLPRPDVQAATKRPPRPPARRPGGPSPSR